MYATRIAREDLIIILTVSIHIGIYGGKSHFWSLVVGEGAADLTHVRLQIQTAGGAHSPIFREMG